MFVREETHVGLRSYLAVIGTIAFMVMESVLRFLFPFPVIDWLRPKFSWFVFFQPEI